MFFNFDFVHANHTQSTKTTSADFSRGCSEPSFHTPHSAKEHSTLQIVDGKVEAI